MAIRKFHRVEDMTPPVAPEPARPWRRIAELWALSSRLCPRRFPAGVHRNRSIDEANRRRERWARKAG